MKIHNTLTRQTEDFVPIDPDMVRIYSCGPTVYDSAHIGNLSSYVYADILRRTLNLAGHGTKHVMNITDVDDKTIRESAQKYPNLPARDALRELTDENYQEFINDMQAVGNDTDNVEFVRATDSIDQIKKLINFLLDAGVAYTADDGIYFSIAEYSRDHKYGQLSKIELPSEMKSRINNDEYDKDSVQDFALWKAARDGEPAWDFEIGGVNMPGRPGWHIECSAMSANNLGQPFDIHTGGIDLVFPHHENEIAQSTAGEQPNKLANYFVHSGHLMVDGAKMAKSKQNFYKLADIVERGFSPLDFRMLVLQGNYQKSVNFSWDNLTAAKNRLDAWLALGELRWQTNDVDDDGQQTIIKNLIKQAADALLDNLNTAQALMYIDQAVDVIGQNLENVSHEAIKLLFDFTKQYLGFDIIELAPNLPQSLRDLITVRETERANGDYARSDEIRDTLFAQGITLRDTEIGTIWSR